MLTFMYEEDSIAALERYEDMFRQAADERALLQFLVSPTRQAVILARSYDSKERTLQVQSKSRDQDTYYYDEPQDQPGLPPFLLAIDDLWMQAQEQGVFLATELVADDAAGEVPPPVLQEEACEVQAAPADDYDEADSNNAEAFSDAVDAFIADFSIEGDQGATAQDEAVSPEEPAEEEAVEDEQSPSGEAVSEEPEEGDVPQSEGIVLPQTQSMPVEPAAAAEPEEPVPSQLLQDEPPSRPRTVRKANVGMLILYILLAIPAGLAGTALLLVPTLFCLMLAACFVSGGVLVLTAAFGGFTIFADLMVVVGMSLVLLALGLLFTWLFIWFIGGAITGLVRALCELGSKCCYKEVPAP